MAGNEIITQEQGAIDAVKRLMNIVVGLSNDVFKSGVDFGAIPGTGDKPVLLQPGMEKLLRALNLRAEYVERSKVEDFDKPLFFYRYECRLIDYETGICVGTAIGSANSHESKWRWRNAERVCPNCGKATIIKGKEEYGGGWLCFQKKGGCGTKFNADAPEIVNQVVGRVENPDIMDIMNTCDKIAQKRSLGSAIKTVANVSMLYTVDLEDFAPYDTANVVQGSYTVMDAPNVPKESGTTMTTKADDFAKQFPAAKYWAAGELYDAMHDYFNSLSHFERHMDKHAAEYAGATLEEASALVRKLHWNYDKANIDRLCAWADGALRMSPANVAEAMGVKSWRAWERGSYQEAQDACTVWAENMAAADLAREGES